MDAYSFGPWLRRRRKALDLTRAALADRVGCSEGTIQKLENEERRPSEQIAARLAEIFDVSALERPAFLRFARGEMRAAPAAEREGAPWDASAAFPRSNLPAALTSLVGREQEIADVRGYLSRAEVRLVTLTGPPGIGKTRLSLEAARGMLPDFSGGVFFAALAPLEDPGLIGASVAQSMGYVGPRNTSTLVQLQEGIGDKSVLIVLDNCEHLIEAAASFASSLLSACLHLKILATSRESLRIPGEWIYAVPPLAAADDSPAFRLFVERARAVQADFELSPENSQTISAICTHLDGLPLAIELIAARTRSLPPQPLLERLHEQFLLSADGRRAVPARQKSLHNAIDWSYRLLSDEEQTLFAWLSVFSAAFRLDAAEATFSGAFSRKTVSDLITSLLDKSLLQRAATSGAAPRYAMLATIQEFARQRLEEAGQGDEIRNRHLAYCLDLAARADQELRGQGQPEWLDRLADARADLRFALEWAIRSGQTEKALQLADWLWWFWSMRAEFHEGRQWLGRVLSMPEASSFPARYAAVLTQLAHHTCLQIGWKEAKPQIEEALALARVHGSEQTLANALMVSGIVSAYANEFEAAAPALEKSVALFRTSQDRWGQALAVMSQGYLASRQADLTAALVLNEQALAMFRELGDPYFQSVCLYGIGSRLALQGNWKEGLAALRESLLLAQGLGSTYEVAAGLFRLAETEQGLGQPGRAVTLYYAARHVYGSIGAWQLEDERTLEAALAPSRDALPEAEFETAMAEGRGMSTEQAVSYALALTLEQ